jgi:DNA polymerase-3 subunit gamma/tau
VDEIGLAPDEHAGFSMSMLRMLAFAPEREGSPEPARTATAPAPQAGRMTEGAPASTGRAVAAQAAGTSMPVAVAGAVAPAAPAAAGTARVAPAASVPAAARPGRYCCW